MAVRLVVSEKLTEFLNVGFSINLKKLFGRKKKPKTKRQKKVKDGVIHRE